MYWYDSISGAWGRQDGPTLGFIQSGLALGGSLQANASNGKTGVFINGRQLPLLDVFALQQFVFVWPGQYWVDAQGNFGFKGGPMLGNLWVLQQKAQRAKSRQHSYGAWTASSSTGTVGGDGNGFLFYSSRDGKTDWMN
jgi:hypothetical protein